MPRNQVEIELPANCEAVFDLLHDYDRRLDWDSMLKEARLLGDAKAAAAGVRTRCVGTWRSGGIAMDTEYLTFERGRVAAVRMVNRPWFFDRFAATMRHHPLTSTASRLTYIYSFRSRPRSLSWLFEPILNHRLQRETQTRLRSLRAYLQTAAPP